MSDEPLDPAVPARVAVAVAWARTRRPLRAPLGVLLLEGGRVQVLDQQSAVRFDAAVSELTVSRDGKWKLRLQGGDESLYVSGLAVQEARAATTREFIARHDAVLVAPKPTVISERHWRRTLTSRHWASAPADVRSQKLVWQATLLAVLRLAGASVSPDER